MKLPFCLTIAVLSLFEAGTGFCAEPVAPPPITVACDQPTGIYASGQPAVFTITRSDAGESAPPATVNILRDNREVVLTETVSGTESSRAISFTPPSNGWYVCSFTLPGQKPVLGAGMVVNPDAYRPSMPLTDAQREIEEANPDQKKKIEGLLKDGYTCENLEIPCLDVRPAEAYYAKPKGAAPGKHPAILFFHAAGVDGGWCRSTAANALILSEKNHAIVVDLNAHGMLNGQPQEYYTSLANGELKGYQNMNRDSRDKFYFLGMFLRLMRAIDFLTAQPEWDGKHLICIGISQGGGQTLAAAGLDARVSAVVATVPGLCDLTGPVADRPAGWPGSAQLTEEAARKYFEIAPYFDAVNFCARSKAESLFTVGFVDVTCMAPGVYTAYNQLKPAKRIVTVPNKGHHELSSPTPEVQAQYNAFVLAHCKN